MKSVMKISDGKPVMESEANKLEDFNWITSHRNRHSVTLYNDVCPLKWNSPVVQPYNCNTICNETEELSTIVRSIKLSSIITSLDYARFDYAKIEQGSPLRKINGSCSSEPDVPIRFDIGPDSIVRTKTEVNHLHGYDVRHSALPGGWSNTTRTAFESPVIIDDPCHQYVWYPSEPFIYKNGNVCEEILVKKFIDRQKTVDILLSKKGTKWNNGTIELIKVNTGVWALTENQKYFRDSFNLKLSSV